MLLLSPSLSSSCSLSFSLSFSISFSLARARALSTLQRANARSHAHARACNTHICLTRLALHDACRTSAPSQSLSVHVHAIGRCTYVGVPNVLKDVEVHALRHVRLLVTRRHKRRRLPRAEDGYVQACEAQRRLARACVALPLDGFDATEVW